MNASRPSPILRSPPRRLGLVLLLACILAGAASSPTSAAGKIVQRPVNFAVENANTSRVPCLADGERYRVAGHLVGPRSALRRRSRAVTLYVHGLGFGEFFWRFREVPGYNYARAMARAGHVSVVVDRLGYDASGHPQGQLSCVGTQASVAHQLVGGLRSGDYAVGRRGRAWAFDRVALAGHSLGGQIAQIEAYSFNDIDALLVLAYADQGSSPLAASTFVGTGLVCATGGQAAEDGGGPGGYAYFGQTASDFRAAMFHNAAPSVIATATAARNRDPCGDIASTPSGIISDQLSLAEVAIPVLIVCANQDALFERDGCAQQRDLYTGSPDVSDVFLEDTGHALTLERTRRTLHERVSAWLEDQGL